MLNLSSRAGGTVIAALGLALSVFHARTAELLRDDPALAVVDGALPLVLSAVMVLAGAGMARGRLVPDQFVERVLAWVGVGVLALLTAAGWLFAHALTTDALPPDPVLTLLNAATFGSLVGYLVGVYDARRRRQQLRADQLRHVNDTLRIVTQDIVDADDRSELERRVCERLQESSTYESAWIGRYERGAEAVRPDAWSGLDDEYYESVVVTVDEDDPLGRGLGGRAVRTGEIQCSQDVAADPSMEPWQDLIETYDVASIAVVPIVDDDAVVGILSLYADRPFVFDEPERTVLAELGETIGHAVSSLEAREQLRQRERELENQNRHLEEFASVVSHDLRNPLNVAQGSLTLEREERDSDHLRRASDALARMDELVDQVLTLARTGTVVSEFASVDLEAVAAEAWRTTRTGPATLDVEAPLGAVPGDESRIRELFENLYRNAVEHSSTSPRSTSSREDAVEHGSTNPDSQAREGAVEHGSTNPGSQAPRGGDSEHGDEGVTVTVGATDGGFYVADDGSGIPESDRESVFEAGFSTSDEGTGFGLNIVRSIADAHGWDVSVTESEAGGARFEFTNVGTADGGVVGRESPSE
ncbi:sensor histidine kinase [Halomicrobium urmianum]|uniref:sensor histidine kinase n=1 Tax=Halomicrobium urmianum TaxID=1586233 RepID=UPI001CD970D5|nr:GAF domain-containing protein [Halomicrobium urmianum]